MAIDDGFDIGRRVEQAVPAVIGVPVYAADYLPDLNRRRPAATLDDTIAKVAHHLVVISVIILLPSAGRISLSITACFMARVLSARVTCFM
jgi:hypothetical protein